MEERHRICDLLTRVVRALGTHGIHCSVRKHHIFQYSSADIIISSNIRS